MTKKRVNPTKKENCFVIMPFSGDWSDDYYSQIYCPAITEAGLEPHRADDLFAPNNVVEDIWGYTQKAKIILADLTGKNPNVFYELGLAHAIAKPAILVTESEEDIPFDLRAIRIIKYNKNQHNWGEILKNSITKSIVEILKNPENSVPSPFLRASSAGKGSNISVSEKELIELRQDVELLKKEMQSSSLARREGRIRAHEARKIIETYVNDGMPSDAIIEKVSSLGAPAPWIVRQIKELKN